MENLQKFSTFHLNSRPWLPICPAATAVFLPLLFAEIAAIELLLLMTSLV
jgi:hypothetical protein